MDIQSASDKEAVHSFGNKDNSVCSVSSAHRNTHSSNFFKKLLQYIAIILLRFKNILEGATRCESPASFQYFNIFLFILNVPLVCIVC